MARQESAPLKSATKGLLIAAFAILVGIAAATAFSIGFTGSLQDSLADPASAPAVRIAALERIRDDLGSESFLKAYRAFTGGDVAQASELERTANGARNALASLDAAAETQTDRDDTKAIAAVIGQFVHAAHNAIAGNDAPRLEVLEQSYSGLKTRIARALDAARYRRMDTLARTLDMAQTLSILALTALSVTLFGLAWFLRKRMVDPLRTLRQSTERAADGGVFRQVWGIERKDEIGALARAINRMRRQIAAGQPEVEGSPVAELRAVLDNKPFVPEYAGGVAAAAKDLEARLHDILNVVQTARDQIEGASQDAALASKSALEAVGLAREGAEQLANRAERMIVTTGSQARATLAGLTASVARLNDAVARMEEGGGMPIRAPLLREPEPPRERSIFGRSRERERETIRDAIREPMRAAMERQEPAYGMSPFSRFSAPARDEEPAREHTHMLSGLANDLDRLEHLAANDGGLTADQAADLTASLIEAIDRLNGVVERVAAQPNPRTRRF